MIRPALVSLVMLAAVDLDAVDPYTMTVVWPDGETEQIAATNAGMCDRASIALMERRWKPVGHAEPPVEVTCAPGSAFAEGWDCIGVLSCPRRGR